MRNSCDMQNKSILHILERMNTRNKKNGNLYKKMIHLKLNPQYHIREVGLLRSKQQYARGTSVDNKVSDFWQCGMLIKTA